MKGPRSSNGWQVPGVETSPSAFPWQRPLKVSATPASVFISLEKPSEVPSKQRPIAISLATLGFWSVTV
ncbi:hypothetical protein EYF80_032662 [Liparis tanakae]|uniref:Uncharacterized protein n=1 Tax=Liparis tanakae TaxID=230148 RepID=A0A4Z2GTZ2_9TELE|nr:hypothetical protein EYF80_032662 [Liparis tanakae]